MSQHASDDGRLPRILSVVSLPLTTTPWSIVRWGEDLWFATHREHPVYELTDTSIKPMEFAPLAGGAGE